MEHRKRKVVVQTTQSLSLNEDKTAEVSRSRASLALVSKRNQGRDSQGKVYPAMLTHQKKARSKVSAAPVAWTRKQMACDPLKSTRSKAVMANRRASSLCLWTLVGSVRQI